MSTTSSISQGSSRRAAQVIALEENYRSVQPILDSANALMAEATRQYRKNLRSARVSQQRPQYVTVADDTAQADYVVHQVMAARERGTLLKHQAVLMRSSHHSDGLELELVRRNIPYVKYGGLKFLEAAHVKDVLGVLRWADNPRHRLAAFRTLQLLPGVGPAHADRCFKVLEAAQFEWQVLRNCQMPSATRDDWSLTWQLLADLAASTRWEGQLARVRSWYQPHLQRLYEATAVRAWAISSSSSASRISSAAAERFLTELTLDPPEGERRSRRAAVCWMRTTWCSQRFIPPRGRSGRRSMCSTSRTGIFLGVCDRKT